MTTRRGFFASLLGAALAPFLPRETAVPMPRLPSNDWAYYTHAHDNITKADLIATLRKAQRMDKAFWSTDFSSPCGISYWIVPDKSDGSA